MKRRGLTLFAGLASAGALALTGLVGAQAPANTETTETVEYKVKENASSLSECGNKKLIGTYTRYNSFEQCIRGEAQEPCSRYAMVYVKGYKGDVLAISKDNIVKNWHNATDYEASHRAGNTAYSVSFYTKDRNGHIILAGYLDAEKPIKIKDGVIYACNEMTYETYILTPDGKELVHKDYIDFVDNTGYTNDTSDENNRHSFNGGMKGGYELSKKYESASDIEFKYNK
ncbi:hypothetical protein D6853_10090 [Butyrivibrio sp. X503]|uniref:hypothetical protein n=1 Tax=Butyrivibrio sp. X503 TaxID=2364878 RepID=UPI000EA97658|nr:hypothetical protein [Butyrivibrio sp. X503]RKM55887.1 hypothetical protein D6853_10090 [Butyrivibrio sp. X503]